MHATNTCYNKRCNLLSGLVLVISIIGLADRSAHINFHYVQFSCISLYLLTTYLNTIDWTSISSQDAHVAIDVRMLFGGLYIGTSKAWGQQPQHGCLLEKIRKGHVLVFQSNEMEMSNLRCCHPCCLTSKGQSKIIPKPPKMVRCNSLIHVTNDTSYDRFDLRMKPLQSQDSSHKCSIVVMPQIRIVQNKCIRQQTLTFVIPTHVLSLPLYQNPMEHMCST